MQERFENTKRVITIRYSQFEEEQTIQWPKEKEQTTIYKTIHRKLKIETTLKTGVHSGPLEGKPGPVPHVALVMLRR